MKVLITLDDSNKRVGSWRKFLASGVLLGLAIAADSAMSASPVDPEADRILRSMTTYLGGLSAFSMNADVDSEIVNLEGQKIQLSSSATMVIERPDKFHARRQGVIADAEVIFNGNTVTIHGKNRNAYFQMEHAGTIDDALNAVQTEIDLDVPGVDLIYADSYPSFASGITSSSYLGTAYVDGVECHHLTFRKAKVDWQLWVKVGEKPLPMKYVITTKWVTGAPQYSIRYRNWNTNPQIDASQFAFSAPEGAKKLEVISVDHVGEAIMGEDK